MKALTRAEEQVMQVLWKLDKAFVKDIIAELPKLPATNQKPAYNTISTIVRLLEKKGFVGHTAYGKTHQYYPMISKDVYRKDFLNRFLGNYFGGSFHQMVSFFVKENDMELEELEEMMKYIEKDIKSTTDEENSENNTNYST